MILELSSQNIDELIQGIECIIKSRCPLLDEDRKLLMKVVITLKKCKRKRSLMDTTNLLLIVKAVDLLVKFFV